MIRLPPYRPQDTTQSVYEFSMAIDGVVVRYRLEWRPRRDAWYMTLWADGEEVINGRRLTERAACLWRVRRSPPLPPGDLVLASVANDKSECTQAGLGWTHLLWWVEPLDMAMTSKIRVTVT